MGIETVPSLPRESAPSDAGARIGWIDTLRGIGIACVVVGHVTTHARVHHYIYLFHMPLFFALSGFMFKRTDPRALLPRRISSLLLPYACYLVLITGLDWLLCAFDGVTPSIPTHPFYTAIEKFALGGNYLHEALTVAWFVTCLFAANMLYALVAWWAGSAVGVRMTGIALAMLVLAYLLPPLRAPWALTQVPLAFFYFWAGATCRAYDRVSVWGLALALVAALVSVPLAPDFDMKYMTVGVLWLNVPAALAICYLLQHLARLASRVGVLKTVFGDLGRAALVIMFFHKIVQIHLQPWMSEWMIMPVALAIGYLIYRLAETWPITRALLLGQGGPVPWLGGNGAAKRQARA